MGDVLYITETPKYFKEFVQLMKLEINVMLCFVVPW